MLNLNGVCTGCTIISIIIALTLHQVYLIGQGPDSFWYAKQGCRYKPAALFFILKIMFRVKFLCVIIEPFCLMMQN